MDNMLVFTFLFVVAGNLYLLTY